jgi:simple sugar transport system substrate-binding protein
MTELNNDADHDAGVNQLTSGGLSRRRLLRGAGVTAAAAALAACTTKGSDAPAAAAAGAGSGTTKNGSLVWATHVYYNQPALIGIEVGFRDALRAFGWKFKITAAKTTGDVQQTIDAQQQALALKPDAIIATMTDPTSFNASLGDIQKAGIYLGLNNTQPDKGNPFGAPYVGQSFFNAGVAVTNMVLDAAVKNGKKDGVFLMGYCCGNQGAVGTRSAGQKQGVADYNKANGTNFTISQVLDTSDSDPASAQGTWEAKLTALGDKCIAIICDQVGDPSIQAMKAQNKKPGWVPIGTFDVTTARLDLLKQDWFIGVVDQQPYAQGFISATQAVMQVTSQTRPTLLYDTGSAIITKDTLADSLKGIDYINKQAKAYGIKGS